MGKILIAYRYKMENGHIIPRIPTRKRYAKDGNGEESEAYVDVKDMENKLPAWALQMTWALVQMTKSELIAKKV